MSVILGLYKAPIQNPKSCLMVKKCLLFVDSGLNFPLFTMPVLECSKSPISEATIILKDAVTHFQMAYRQ